MPSAEIAPTGGGSPPGIDHAEAAASGRWLGTRGPSDGLNRVRRVAFVVFGLELLALMIWSSILYSRYALTVDFAGAEQAWSQMAHGHLNPVVGAWQGTHFLRNHAEATFVLVAPLYWIWHSGVVLLWVQDLAAVLTSLVAFTWIAEVVQGRTEAAPGNGERMRRGGRGTPTAAQLASAGLVLLAVNPWVLWTVSFDFHIQTMATLFALLLAFDLAHGRNRRALVWVVLALGCGDVAATFVFGVGLSAVIVGKDTRRVGVLLMLSALAFTATLTAVGANLGSQLRNYAPPSIVGPAAARAAALGGSHTLLTVAKSLITKPFSYLSFLGGNALNIYANMAPAGIIGIGAAWGFGVPVVVLLSNDLRVGAITSLTSFQNFPIYPFLTLGTITVLVAIANRWPRVAGGLAVVLVANALIWSVVWTPKAVPEWLKVPSATAATLNAVSARIPSGDEVVTSEGITGPLPARGSYFPIVGNVIAVKTNHVWFVLTPEEGIEIQSAYQAFTQLAYLIGPLHGRLVTAANGVYAVEVTPAPGVRSITLPTRCSAIPAWESASRVGQPVTTGPVSSWAMHSNGGSGYLVDGSYLRVPRGTYLAAVSLASAGPVTVEVWDADRSVLLARHEVPTTNGRTSIEVPFTAFGPEPRPRTEGMGLWRVDPIPPPSDDAVEIRVYTPGSDAFVYTTAIVPSPSAGSEPC